MSVDGTSARDHALKDLAANAASFDRPVTGVPAPAGPGPEAGVTPPARRRAETVRAPEPVTATAGPAEAAGYVPVAVAPERGNTRPVVPVDGRLHMRVAQATLDALDALVADWKDDNPGRRDLERATLVRIGLALVLADVREHGDQGAVGEAVAAALDPAVRHTANPMPPLERWITPPARSR